MTIFHNPRCSKSRQTLELLHARGIEVEIVKYLEEPLGAGAVLDLLRKLGGEPSSLLRKKEDEYKTLSLSDDVTAEEVAEAIAKHPRLMERPVVAKGERAVIGRPPERVLEYFGL